MLLHEEKFKQQLLKEANSRVIQCQLQKSAMAYWAGESNLKNSNSVNYKLLPAGKHRIESIRDSIENSFLHYLRDRVVDPESHKKDTKLSPISPGVGVYINPKSVQNGDQEVPLKILEVDTHPVPGMEFDTGFQPGHLYFRYTYQRNIIPSRYPKDKKRALDFLYEIANVVDTDKSSLAEFMARLRKGGIALLPYCHRQYSDSGERDTSAINSQMAQSYVKNIHAAQARIMQTAYGQKKLMGHIDSTDVENIAIPSSVKRKITYKNQDIDLFDNTQIPSELNRQLFWKICCGYTLDVNALHKVVEDYINKYMSQFKISGKDNYGRRLRKQWQDTEGVLIRLFKTIESRAPVEFGRAITSWRNEDAMESISDPIEMYGHEDMPQAKAQYRHGIPFYGANEGARCYINDNHTKTCVNIGSLHLKMLLLSCTQDQPENFEKCNVQVRSGKLKTKTLHATDYTPLPDADEYIDPRSSTRSIPDGMSDSQNVNMAQRGHKMIGLPPMIKIPIGNRQHEVQLDRHNCNLGRKHLAKVGLSILRLLEWSESTNWPITAMIKLSQAYQNGTLSPETAEVYKLLSTGTFSSDVFCSVLERFGSSPEMFNTQHVSVGMSGEDDKEIATENESMFLADDRSLRLLHKHGPSLSAMMDFIYAIMHRASKDLIKVHTPSGEVDMTAYGQKYSGSSGAGGGGEVLLSIKFAYSAKMEQIGGSESIDAWKKQRRKYHDPRLRAKDPLLRATDPRNLGQSPEQVGQTPMTPLDEDAVMDDIRPHLIEKLSFWVGQSSSQEGSAGQRITHMKTLWPQNEWEGQDWQAALNYFYLRNPFLAEDTGDRIFEAGLDLKKFQHSISESINNVRKELRLQNQITFTTEFGTEIIGDSLDDDSVVQDISPQSELHIETPVSQPDVQRSVPTAQPASQQLNTPMETNTPVSMPRSVQQLPTTNIDTNIATMPQSQTNVSSPEISAPSQPSQRPVRKREPKRKLFKSISSESDDRIHKLIRIADQLDHRGMHSTADKIDHLIDVFLTSYK